MTVESEPESRGTSVAKVVKVGFVIFLVLLVALAAVAYFLGDDLLPMEYEGFD